MEVQQWDAAAECGRLVALVQKVAHRVTLVKWGGCVSFSEQGRTQKQEEDSRRSIHHPRRDKLQIKCRPADEVVLLLIQVGPTGHMRRSTVNTLRQKDYITHT